MLATHCSPMHPSSAPGHTGAFLLDAGNLPLAEVLSRRSGFGPPIPPPAVELKEPRSPERGSFLLAPSPAIRLSLESLECGIHQLPPASPGAIFESQRARAGGHPIRNLVCRSAAAGAPDGVRRPAAASRRRSGLVMERTADGKNFKPGVRSKKRAVGCIHQIQRWHVRHGTRLAERG
jgi:hypothetical protein